MDLTTLSSTITSTLTVNLDELASWHSTCLWMLIVGFNLGGVSNLKKIIIIFKINI